ncbi:pseudouridine synthase [uncultured Sphingomonas sp.]|uniref:pseudouridine synthase n=1 Tax=uncultured Sphingomonas sp. TaxID=158754 RepID=UPI0035CBAA66
MADEPKPEQRIAKLLARAGIASRREIERMIADGRIALDGRVLDTPATLLRSLHGVAVDGQPVAAPPPAQLFLYHKPPGLLVTEHDPAGRPIIYDRLPDDLPRLVPVGRLDLATEGLLLLTTDGGLKRQLELPATGVERAYRARTYGEISQERLEELIEGIEIDGIRYGPIDANLERRTGANTWIELILTEGKNREVRRVLEHLGLQVSRLLRTRYGPFLLGDLKPGEIGEVRQHDLVAFRKTLGKPADRADTITVDARAAGGRTRSSQTEQPAARPVRSTAASRTDPPRTRVGEWERPAKSGGGGASAARDMRRPPPPDPRRKPTDRRPEPGQRAHSARDASRPTRPARADDRADRPQRAAPARGQRTDDRRPARADARPPKAARPDDRPQRPTRAAPTETGPGRRGRSDRDAPRPVRVASPSTSRAKTDERARPPRPSQGDDRRRPSDDLADRRPPRSSPDRSDASRDRPARTPSARGKGPPRESGKPPAFPRPGGGGRGPTKR